MTEEIKDFRQVRKAYSNPNFTWIEADKNNTKRITTRFITKGWWFDHMQKEGMHVLIFSEAIDLQRDIRDKLKGIEFSLV